MAQFDFPKNFDKFTDFPKYEGDDLGLTYSAKQSTFKLWSPDIDSAKVHIYEAGEGGQPIKSKPLEKSKDGVWETTIPGDLKGRFYTFQVMFDGEWLPEATDIYAKAVGVNGRRAAIIDLSEAKPAGWDDDRSPELKEATDVILYEIHVRDFSTASNSGMHNKGKFLAFTEEGTKNSFGQKTGIDHLEELGITHVHLMPIYDYATIDEAHLEENNYNWGYDPQNYNVPEGSYSTDPRDPKCRIIECKQMIQALHKKGIRVVMDVVYNHVYKWEESNFTRTVPGYYFRQYESGDYGNASGCGNETASERYMMRRFMIDSIRYWAKEYHIDGFRFDLMAIHDMKTMQEIRAMLNTIDPSIFIYGEGWTGGDSPLAYEKRTVKQHINQIDGVAVFSDDIRDALKGTWSNAKEPGFASGHMGYEETVKFGVVAATQHDNIHYGLLNYINAPYANTPSQVINYVSCHDDLCLNDKLQYSAPEGYNPIELKKFNRLAQTIIMTIQGVPFIYGGEEVFRNKKGVHNTYQSPDSINQIDWDFKKQHEEIFNYYKGIIWMRRNHRSFRLPTTELIQQKLHFINPNHGCVVAYTIDGVEGDNWKRVLVIYNGNRYNVSLGIPQDNWFVVCNGSDINEKGLYKWNQNYINAPASSAMILCKK